VKRTRLKPQSAKRRRENRERRKAMIAAFGESPRCRFPACTRPADDAHEILSRARGGSITDPANVAPLCRVHHTFVTEHPAEAERLGLSLPSWDGVA